MSSKPDLASMRGTMELSSAHKLPLHSTRSVQFSWGRDSRTDRSLSLPVVPAAYTLASSLAVQPILHSPLQACRKGAFARSNTSIRHVHNTAQSCHAMEVDSVDTHHTVAAEKHEAAPAAEVHPLKSEKLQFDVVIVGAGIIGLSIAHQILCKTDFSVALLDASKPCAGATGAGQGYVWLGHRSPETVSWHLAGRSRFLWQEFARQLHGLGLDPLTTIGFKKTGSLLFGTSSEHALALQERSETLQKNGIGAEFLDSIALKDVEPELCIGAKGSAILTFDDFQIDAQLTASYILGEVRKYSLSNRFQEFFHDPVVNFLWAGQVTGVQTTRREIYCNRKVIMAAGAWSGDVMQNLFKRLSTPHVLATKPRKGHLLVFEGLPQISLRHGLMEFAYEKLADSSDSFGIASTATIDAKGRLLLGSSRQFAGFDFSLEYNVMESILEKAVEYLPALGRAHLEEALNDGSVRVGHRPYVPDGRPMIGKIPGLEGLFLATGHEGEGLTLSLGTAEMIVDLLLEKDDLVVDPSPFSPAGRLIPSH